MSMSGHGEILYPLPPGFEIKREIKEEYDGDVPPVKKARGRKKGSKNQKQTTITDSMPVRKKRDRFNGMPEEEVVKRVLPDHLAQDLDIVIVGINPGLCAAYVGHHYAGPGNHFWKCMYLSGLIPEPLTANDDFKLLNYGIGFTNIVARTTRGSADLSRKEIKEGAQILTEKLQKYKPKIAVFNGKGIYEVFVGHKNFAIGKQPDLLAGTETTVYVMPSSSARCSQLPRAVDKVPFYASLKKLRDYLRGDLKELDDSEVCFPDLELKVVKKEPKQEIKEEVDNSCAIPFSQSSELCYPSNIQIKQEPVYNQSQYGIPSNQNCFSISSSAGSPTQQSSYPSSQSNFSPPRNGDMRYQMMYQSTGNSPQNFQMGDNSIKMSQVMMQGKQESPNLHMMHGSMQTFSGNAVPTFSFQQTMAMNNLNGHSSAQVMVQSSYQGNSQFPQYSQPSINYYPNMMTQSNYMNYQNHQQHNYENPNYNQNASSRRSSCENDVTVMGFSQGQGHTQGNQFQYCQTGTNFIKQEPQDFSNYDKGSSCDNRSPVRDCTQGQQKTTNHWLPQGQNYQQHNYGHENPNYNQNASSRRSSCENDVTAMGFSQGQGHTQGNQFQYCQTGTNFIKQEPKDFSNFDKGSSCEGRSPVRDCTQGQQEMTNHGQCQIPDNCNSVPPVHIKEEPRDFNDYSNTCRNSL